MSRPKLIRVPKRIYSVKFLSRVCVRFPIRNTDLAANKKPIPSQKFIKVHFEHINTKMGKDNNKKA